MQREALDLVGAGDERDARPMQTPDEVDHARVGLVVERMHALVRDLHATAHAGALEARRHIRHDGCERRGALAVALAQEIEGGERRVDHRAALLQELDERLNFRAVEIEARRALGRQIETLQCARIGLVVDQEVQHHLVDVVDLIEARLHDLGGAHESRHMAADAQTAGVGVGDGVAQMLTREAVVDLDLDVAMRRIPVDRALGLLERADDEATARAIGALALEEPRRDDLRPEDPAIGRLVDDLLQRCVVVADIAGGGDARGEVQATAPTANVPVHVKETWQQHAPRGIDLTGGCHPLERRIRARDGDDPAALKVDIAQTVVKPRVLGIKHPRVADHAQARHRLRQPRRHAAEQLGLGLLLDLRETAHVVLIALGQAREIPRCHDAEQFRVRAGRRPDELRREAEPGERHEFHFAPRRALSHRRPGECPALRAAHRQHFGDLAARCHTQQRLVYQHGATERQIELAHRVIGPALLGGRAPGATAAFGIVALIDP